MKISDGLLQIIATVADALLRSGGLAQKPLVHALECEIEKCKQADCEEAKAAEKAGKELSDAVGDLDPDKE